MPDDIMQLFDHMAGIAALINGLLLWPVVRRLSKLEPRVERLERARTKKRKTKRTPK